ncbi:Auxin efflux carrier [Mycena venus]|uniref:Auxin efflux carrier n=1 Tax=Mycena venus TaxID=2733690 RepID=A0A8H7CLM2_9AGAR|nr:Auxin efflux carrier [Mycena venus]
MHINPYATWSNSNVRRAVPGVPSVHGALPFTADPTASNLVVFHFASFKPSILNCTVLGKNTYPYFTVTTDPAIPGYTAVKNADGKPMALIEWKDGPLVEIRGILPKQRVSDWLTLSGDGSHRTMKVNEQQYIWAPQRSTISLYPAGTQTPELLARISRREDGTVSLEITSTAVTAGLVETCVVATFLLQCGHKIDYLMFSKIVPSFSVQNIGALGPIVLIAVVYQVLGGVVAWIVTQFFWVPHRFRWGILVAGVWANVGDIPTAVVLSIMGAAPFNGSADQTLSVGYISGFLFVSMITFFPLGGNRLVALDFVGPDLEPEDVKEVMRRRRRRIFVHWPRLAIRHLMGRKAVHPNQHDEKSLTTHDPVRPVNEVERISRPCPTLPPKHVSFYEPADEARSDRISGGPSNGWQSRVTSPAPTTTAVDTHDILDSKSIGADPVLPTSSKTNPVPISRTQRRRITGTLLTFLRNLLIPPSISIVLSFAIALAPPLKALFVSIDSFHIHPAPDGQPPLAFVMDAATFIGAASVPMGLVCLGSALARLRMPRGSCDTLPVGAILAFSVGKMLVFPVLGVLLCKGLVHVGVIASDDKVLQFICMFFACLPTGTTQVFVTQVASGTGSAEHLSAFLIPQYALMLVSMTALTAYALQTLF